MTIDQWAKFLDHEKLSPDRVNDPMELVKLCEELAKLHPDAKPFRSYKDRLEARKMVCETAIALGMDLTKYKFKGKMAMGRGLLDIWNKVYSERFGSNIGTAHHTETVRRNIVTKLRKEGVKPPRRFD